jgi:hypothetical protein
VAYIACYRSSAGSPAGLSLADVSFIVMGAFLPRRWRAFLTMRRLPCCEQGSRRAPHPVVSDGSDSLAPALVGVQRCCAQACG